jgi:hypothetical protein
MKAIRDVHSFFQKESFQTKNNQPIFFKQKNNQPILPHTHSNNEACLCLLQN